MAGVCTAPSKQQQSASHSVCQAPWKTEELPSGPIASQLEGSQQASVLRLQSKAAVMPSSPYRFWFDSSTFHRKSVPSPSRFFPGRAGRLLGLIPAREEFLRRLGSFRLSIRARAQPASGVLLPISKRARLPSLLEYRRKWSGRSWLRSLAQDVPSSVAGVGSGDRTPRP